MNSARFNCGVLPSALLCFGSFYCICVPNENAFLIYHFVFLLILSWLLVYLSKRKKSEVSGIDFGGASIPPFVCQLHCTGLRTILYFVNCSVLSILQ